TNVETVLDGPAAGIAIDWSAQHLYWTDAVNDSIRRTNLDGSNAEMIYGWLGSTPTLINLDPSSQKMYWIRGGMISRATVDGSNVENIIPGPASGIALDSP